MDTPSKLKPPRPVDPSLGTPTKPNFNASGLPANTPQPNADNPSAPTSSAKRRMSLRKRRLESSSDEAIGAGFAAGSSNPPSASKKTDKPADKETSPRARPRPKKLALQAEALANSSAPSTSTLKSKSLANAAKTTSSLQRGTTNNAASAIMRQYEKQPVSALSGPNDVNVFPHVIGS